MKVTGVQMFALSWSMTVGLAGSLQVTVTVLLMFPLKLPPLNWIGILPVPPGAISRSQVPAVVQPHPGRTSESTSVALPVLV